MFVVGLWLWLRRLTFSSIKTTLKSKLLMTAPTDGSGRYQAFRRYLWFGRHCCIVTWSITSIMLLVKKFSNDLLNIQWNCIKLRKSQEVSIGMLQSAGLNDQPYRAEGRQLHPICEYTSISDFRRFLQSSCKGLILALLCLSVCPFAWYIWTQNELLSLNFLFYIFFYICSSVHRNSRLKKSNKMQQYGDIYLLLNYSTCFGRPLHPIIRGT